MDNVLKEINYKKICGNTEMDIKSLSINSKNELKDSLFIAIDGFKQDGHDYVKEAASNGAIASIVQKKVSAPLPMTMIMVDSTREVLPILCRNFYKEPAGSFKLIGITGTNGKTTTCYLINSILNKTGMKTSLITTVESFLNGKRVSFKRTTPESTDLNDFFDKSRKEKIDVACMEISSHSIDLHRIDYLDYDYFVFTNLSQDHLDYHKDMAAYFNVKKKLFLKEYRKIYGGKKAIINVDDSYGEEIFESTDLERVSYSLISDRGNNIWASNIKNSVSGIEMNINTSDGKILDISSPLCGYFNVYNILAAVGVCIDMGIDNRSIQEGVRSLSGVRGRFEKLDFGNRFTVIVDYAHTPDGMEKVLTTTKQILKPGGKIITVFGCGGDRDTKKRKIMGSISGKYADFTILTSDNPRTEEPDSIIRMIEKGLIESDSKEYIKEADRKKAIFMALEMASKNDVIVIAGKGHEEYQEFKDCRIPFSDRCIAEEWLIKKNEREHKSK
ncbi:MAG: UDP-N-acetylmuramoyl-L-alanyl-D-glutamate--2,6-diaminopimelate ligase [Actinomycetota bacterium]|nr:UDP-N-acetylmuramoyl-L-alanyl-D-glutamate--2,6-diaminopimelate ligase [Actinomycetota bacterium]